jgi:hypothetical protein
MRGMVGQHGRVSWALIPGCWRRRVAALLAVASVIALFMVRDERRVTYSSFHMLSGIDQGFDFSPGPGLVTNRWSALVVWVLALALAGAAAGLWAARARRLRVVSGVAGLGALVVMAALLIASGSARSRPVSATTYGAVAFGISASTLRQKLGAPQELVLAQRPFGSLVLSCMVYGARVPVGQAGRNLLFCFDHERRLVRKFAV